MIFLGKLLLSLFDLSVAILDRLGASGPRWEWKKRQGRLALEARVASWEMTERGVRTKVRMCRSCRALVDRSLSICPQCGASMRGVAGGGIGRLLTLILPEVSSLTTVLITANVILLAVPLILWGTGPNRGGLFGLLAPPGAALFVFGEKYAPAILYGGEVWRLVTAGFLHGGIVHLGFNCYALSILGPLVENSFGWRKYLFVYTLTDIAAFATSTFFSPSTPSVGASGPLFGLLGFAIVFGRYRSGRMGKAIADQLVRWLVPAAVMLFMPGIDNAAHVGGFVAGAVLGLLVGLEEPRTRQARILWAGLTALTILVLVGAFLAMLLAYPENVKRVAG